MKAKLLATALSAFCSQAIANTPLHWSYEGEAAPQNWSKLSPDFYLCEQGKSQSPIDITNVHKTHSTPLKVHYQLAPSAVLNNGHSIQVNVPEGNYLSLDGEKFILQQFHFHSPSENTIDGKSFQLEAHFVHMSASGEIAVLAQMFTLGEANAELEKIWRQMPEEVGQSTPLLSRVSLTTLLPEPLIHYRFSGSLTTPPCTEGVRWLVLKRHSTLSADQREAFTRIIHHPNNRPQQALHGRIIIGE